MAERGDRLSAFYTSNVEFYLFGDGRFAEFIDNLSRLPHTSHSLIIRAIFGGYMLPESVPRYYSTSLVQKVDDPLDGFSNARIRSYRGLIGR